MNPTKPTSSSPDSFDNQSSSVELKSTYTADAIELLKVRSDHDSDACKDLGNIFIDGLGIPADFQQGIYFYMKGIKLDKNIDCMYNLAQSYLKESPNRSHDAAIYWLMTASIAGDSECKELLETWLEYLNDGEFLITINGTEFDDIPGACYETLGEYCDNEDELLKYLDELWGVAILEASALAEMEDVEFSLSHLFDQISREDAIDFITNLRGFRVREETKKL